MKCERKLAYLYVLRMSNSIQGFSIYSVSKETVYEISNIQ